MIRATAGIILGTLSAALTYLGTDSAAIAALVGALAAFLVWARIDALIIAVWDE